MNALLFLTIRVIHVLLAAIWIGSTVFTAALLMPAVEAAGPAGGQIMIGLGRRGITAYMAVLGGVTVLTGIYLYWHFTGGFDPVVSSSRSGIAYGIGGVAGILAGIVGGSVVGRSSNNAMSLMEKVATMPDGQEKMALLQQAASLRARIKSGGHLVLILQVVALVLMSIGHYI